MKVRTFVLVSLTMSEIKRNSSHNFITYNWTKCKIKWSKSPLIIVIDTG